MIQYITTQSIKSLCAKLNLAPPDSFSQDWEYEVADYQRMNEFIRFYKEAKLNKNERLTLGIIIIESINDALSCGIDISNEWRMFLEILNTDWHIHHQTLEYWAMWDEVDIDNCFHITSRVRDICPKL